MQAKIVLEDGRIFQGSSFGAEKETSGEVVFNTSLTGYQEIITDPSYRGQIVTMTYPLIGNYGINDQDVESRKPFLSGLVVKECSRIASNWRSQKTLAVYLKTNDIVGIEGVDTRALTRHIRLSGAMKGYITTRDAGKAELLKLVDQARGLAGIDLVGEVTCDKVYAWNDSGKYHVVVIDCGVKLSILRRLADLNCKVTVVPYSSGVTQILALNPNGVLLSNGPGDPAAVAFVPSTVKALIEKKIPIFGICLGHQMLGLALGGKTYKLKFGHHGANQPVKDLRNGSIAITSQNHGYCVDINSLNKDDVEMTHVNLNDNTLEGMRHKRLPVLSVQYHPEAAPGPHDAGYLFEEFINLMKNA